MSESWLPIDSELARKNNCNASSADRLNDQLDLRLARLKWQPEARWHSICSSVAVTATFCAAAPEGKSSEEETSRSWTKHNQRRLRWLGRIPCQSRRADDSRASDFRQWWAIYRCIVKSRSLTGIRKTGRLILKKIGFSMPWSQQMFHLMIRLRSPAGLPCSTDQSGPDSLL